MSGERHIPVMLDEVLAALAPQAGEHVLDGTFGAGGYTRAILEAAPCHVIGVDRDPDAIAGGAALAECSDGRLILVAGQFGDLEDIAREQGLDGLDGVVLDIGVSSMQIDEAERGFSFRSDGPLDMRMSQAGRSAADIVNEASPEELADIIFHFGEERRARQVAKAIVAAREEAPITTTKRLSEIVASVVWTEPGGMNPATRTFQGLRIAVNDELGELVRALHGAERILKPGGRLIVVTFHSLEDRIVKLFLANRTGKAPSGSRHAPSASRDAPTFTPIIRGAAKPGAAEIAANPRARSAKLRAAIRTSAPAGDIDGQVSALSVLPDLRPRRR